MLRILHPCLRRACGTGKTLDGEWDAYYNDLEKFFREGQERGILTLDFSAGVIGDIFISLVTGILECYLWGHLTERETEKTILRALSGGVER